MLRLAKIFSSWCIILILIYSILSIRPFRISGDSMMPDFTPDDIVIVDRISPRIVPYKRGYVIIYKKGSTDIKIKRILGLPGEVLEIKEGNVWKKHSTDNTSSIVEEPYLGEHVRTCVPGACTDLSSHMFDIPVGHFFVLGDNRINSQDSRGCTDVADCTDKEPIYIDRGDIIGRVIFPR